MSAIRAAMPASRQRPFLRRLYGVGCFPRVFDITQAFIGFGLLGATPYQILHHVAGGILGARSYQMGWTSAVIGFVLHFTIAFTAPRLSNTRQARRKLPVLVEHAVCLQTAIWRSSILFMYFVVLPLSALGSAQFNIATYITGTVGHTFLVGLPIAISVRHFAKPSSLYTSR